MGIFTPVCATKRHTAKTLIWCSFMAGLLAVVLYISGNGRATVTEMFHNTATELRKILAATSMRY